MTDDLEKLNIHSSRNVIARHGLTLQELFEFCLEFYKEEKHQFHLTYEQKNQLAAYWRQSTLGPYHPDKLNPGYFDFVGNDRKKAWQALGEISSNGAMAGFCNLLETFCPNLVPWIRHKKREKQKELDEIQRRKEEEQNKKEKEDAESQKLINIVKRAEAVRIEKQISDAIESESDSDEEMPGLEKNIRTTDPLPIPESKPMNEVPTPDNMVTNENPPTEIIQTEHPTKNEPQADNGATSVSSEAPNPSMDPTLAQHFACVMYLRNLKESGHVLTPEQDQYILQMKDFVLAYFKQSGVTPSHEQSLLLQQLRNNSPEPVLQNGYDPDESVEKQSPEKCEKEETPEESTIIHHDEPIIENGQEPTHISDMSLPASDVTAAANVLSNQLPDHAGEGEGEECHDLEVKQWTSMGVDLFIGEVSKEPDSILTVGRGETVTVRIPTYESGSALYWEFATRDYDIGFGASFEWEEENEKATSEEEKDGVETDGLCHREAILPILRRSSHEKVITGTHSYPHSGTYLLFFDNSFSLLRSKTVFYRVFYTR